MTGEGRAIPVCSPKTPFSHRKSINVEKDFIWPGPQVHARCGGCFTILVFIPLLYIDCPHTLRKNGVEEGKGLL
jgi:hypothetical protein